MRHLLLTEADSAIVIASDGMTDVLSDQDAANTIKAVMSEQVYICLCCFPLSGLTGKKHENVQCRITAHMPA